MNDFWSGWVMALVILNYVAILLLFIWAPGAKIPVGEDGTTGHTWANGLIREAVNRLPMWWLVLSTVAFIAAFIYLVRYPGFGSYEGTLGWSSAQQLKEEEAAINQRLSQVWARVESSDVLELSQDKPALKVAQRLFEDNCAACHGMDGKGVSAIGAPNLVNNVWQYGGSVDEILSSITNGRKGLMPPLGKALGYGNVKNVANYALSLSGASHEAGPAAAGKPVFEQQCAACHGIDGTGNKLLGAPNLTTGSWKFGGTYRDIVTAIEYGRTAEMPAWKDRLNESEIKLLAAWVLSHDNDEEARSHEDS